ncbi:MAG TPA: ABC transporter ATP-binding protein [Thermoanaerobaculia bacterium]|nr:ABC transporter ATP-binding protein [Thermoanaerobaculia bacterium]
MTAKPLIELHDVNKIYVTDEIETHVLTSVDLTIEKGEYVSISGPSGCGKSTLLSILGLLDRPTRGSYLLDGERLHDLPMHEAARVRNRNIGFIFQNFNLIGDLTVSENVALPLLYRGMSSDERKAAVEASLAQVGMAHRKRHYPAQLSGGQQQRVAVARAIVGRPSILLADEPTGNLDSKNGAIVMDLIRELNDDGTTICMVTHDARYAEHADRKIRLFDGRLAGEERQESRLESAS